MASSKLFQPMHVGTIEPKHRVVLAPAMRLRADPNRLPSAMMLEYYEQRSRTPGTLLIAEATVIHPKAGGYSEHTAGIWSKKQIAAWKQVTDAVHKNHSYVFLQLWALGRQAHYDVLKEENPDFNYVSASDIPLSSHPDEPAPRPLTLEEIAEYPKLFATASKNAVMAGFDGVEVHAANGYLIDQFIQDVSNVRTDAYGGSIENRSRFCLEVMAAVSEAVGGNRTGIRLSPWSRYGDMRMEDPVAQFTHLVTELRRRFPKLAYLHLVEPRIEEPAATKPLNVGYPSFEDLWQKVELEEDSNDFIRAIWWDSRSIITAGGYDRKLAMEVADRNSNEFIAFARHFFANPDLPYRLLHSLPLNKCDESAFWTPCSTQGYIDYEFASVVSSSRL